MKLIPDVIGELDLAILPVGDNFTMGIDEAIKASKFLNCNRVLGVHFDTFGYITDEYGNILYSDDDSNGNSDFRFDLYLEPGVYYVVVEGYNPSYDYGSFTLKYR